MRPEELDNARAGLSNFLSEVSLQPLTRLRMLRSVIIEGLDLIEGWQRFKLELLHAQQDIGLHLAKVEKSEAFKWWAWANEREFES